MVQVRCQIEIPKAADTDSKEAGGPPLDLTVGKIFSLKCDGDWPAVEPGKVQLDLPEADQHQLKLLNFEFISKSQAQLVVASYKTGNHQFRNLQLRAGDQTIELSDLSFTVKSVIDPKDPVKEPFGPMGPLQLPLPVWYLLSALAVVVTIAAVFLFKWRIRSQRKKMLRQMRLDEMVQEAYYQFYAVLRKLQRSSFVGVELTTEQSDQVVKELNQAFKIYLARHFQVPTLNWPERKILSDLKKNHSEFYQEFQAPLKQALAELARATGPQKQMLLKDCEQLAHLLRTQVDRMELWIKKERK